MHTVKPRATKPKLIRTQCSWVGLGGVILGNTWKECAAMQHQKH
jgi:hypothetical protein